MMSVEQLKVVTGIPVVDNRRRRVYLMMKRRERENFTITSDKGRIARKRKKYMYGVEGAALTECIWAIMQIKMKEAGKVI